MVLNDEKVLFQMVDLNIKIYIYVYIKYIYMIQPLMKEELEL